MQVVDGVVVFVPQGLELALHQRVMEVGSQDGIGLRLKERGKVGTGGFVNR